MLADEPEADGIAARVAAAVGLISDSYPIQEIFWALRRLLEAIATTRPLVALIEDIHWAEPALLDLIDHLAQLSDAAIFLLCTARHDVSERRPGWPPDTSAVVRLEPLADHEVETLVAELLGTTDVETRVRLKVVEAADGNPLFVDQFVSMLIDEGVPVRDDGNWLVRGDLTSVNVPATISALLDVRLEQLEAIERSTLERASVIGRVFSRSSVGDVAMDLSEVLGRAGRAREAREAIEEALSFYERKGNLVSAARARAALAHL